jgi:hypothetical protein
MGRPWNPRAVSNPPVSAELLVQLASDCEWDALEAACARIRSSHNLTVSCVETVARCATVARCSRTLGHLLYRTDIYHVIEGATAGRTDRDAAAWLTDACGVTATLYLADLVESDGFGNLSDDCIAFARDLLGSTLDWDKMNAALVRETALILDDDDDEGECALNNIRLAMSRFQYIQSAFNE